jgi:hypothetical protein
MTVKYHVMRLDPKKLVIHMDDRSNFTTVGTTLWYQMLIF